MTANRWGFPAIQPPPFGAWPSDRLQGSTTEPVARRTLDPFFGDGKSELQKVEFFRASPPARVWRAAIPLDHRDGDPRIRGAIGFFDVGLGQIDVH